MENTQKIKMPQRTRNRVELISIGNFVYYTQKIGLLFGSIIGGTVIGLSSFFITSQHMPSFPSYLLSWLLVTAVVGISVYMVYLPGAKKIEVLPDSLSLRISEYSNNNNSMTIPLVNILSIGKIGKSEYKIKIYSETEKGWISFHSTDTGIDFLFPFFTGNVFNSDVKYLQQMVKYAQKMQSTQEF